MKSQSVRRLRYNDVRKVSTSQLQAGMTVAAPAGEDKFGPYLVVESILRVEGDTIGCSGRHFAAGNGSTPHGVNACYPFNGQWWILK